VLLALTAQSNLLPDSHHHDTYTRAKLAKKGRKVMRNLLTVIGILLLGVAFGTTNLVSAQRKEPGGSQCEKNDHQPDRSAPDKTPKEPKEKAPKEDKGLTGFMEPMPKGN
jgi:hypothetical protein